jgi:HSP20 family molecular chaperone IbpA
MLAQLPHPSTAGMLSTQQAARQQHLLRQQQQAAELSENSEWMRLTVDLPGVYLKDLAVNINQGILSIEGVRRTMSVDGCVCVKKQKISRRYAIDTDVIDVTKFTANLAFGVLIIRAPKNSKPDRVRVDVTENEEAVMSVTNVKVNTQRTLTTSPAPTSSDISASMQAASAPMSNDNEAQATSVQAASAPISNGKEATSTTPPSSTSPMVGASVEEEPGTAQPDDGSSDSIRMDQSS